MILHHAGRHRGRRAGDAHPGAGVDDGDGVACPDGRRLMDFHLAHIAVVVGVRVV